MNDEDLVRGVAELSLTNECFHHREHLRFTRYCVLRDGYPFAIETVSELIARFASRHGQAQKFHVTMTHCWVRIVAAALADEPRDCSFEQLVARHPQLLDKHLPLRYYSRERLFSDAARAGWMEPDLLELPRCPIHRGVAA